MPAEQTPADGRFTSKNNPGARGRERAAELAAENKVAVDQIIGELINGLARPATAGERVEAELIAVTVVKIRRLAERNYDDSKERRFLKGLMNTTVFGSVPSPPPVTTNIFDRKPGDPKPQFRVAEREECAAIPEGAANAE